MTQRPNNPQAKIEIGAVRADELESLLALICEVFQLPYEPARELFYKDPYLSLENKRVLRVNGRIVSCLTIADREEWLGNATVRVGGIAGVATHPDERNKGYASLLLEDTLAYLKAQGYALSALIPYSSHFYRRFGYEVCGNVCRLVTAPSYLPHSHEIRNVRPARPDDCESIAECYGIESIERTFYGIRDRKRWEYLLQRVEQCHVYTEENGKITGYLLSDLRQTPPIVDGIASMPTLRIVEFIARTESVEHGLLTHLAAQNSVGMIEFALTRRELAWKIQDLTGVGIGEEILANIEVVPMLMASIVNFRPLIETKLMMTDWHGSLRIEIHDKSSALSVESWTVICEPTSNTIRSSVESDFGLPCLSADIRVWAQVMTGFKGAEIAIARGLLFASDSEAEEKASLLFPELDPFLPIPDHF